MPFIEDLANQIETNLSIHPVCQAFSCLDPKNFPEDNIPEFGMNEMEVLKAHYGGVKEGKHPITGHINRQDPKISNVEVDAEYDMYKMIVCELNSKFLQGNVKKIASLRDLHKGLSSKRNVERKLINLAEEISTLESKRGLSLSDILEELKKTEFKERIPNILILLEKAVLCPIGNAVCERLFSLLKIVKTKLRNSILDPNLDKLLRINKECPEELQEYELDKLVDMFKDHCEEKAVSKKMRMAL